jgi:hypothetical protein
VGYRDAVNTGLERATGYKLVRADQLAALRARKEKAKAPATLPRHFDEAAKRITRAAKPRTMTGYDKLFALVEAVRYVVDQELPGAFVECGVWRGGSMQAVALALLDRGVTDRELHLFDTFEGMTEPTDEDVSVDGTPAATRLATEPRTAWVWAVATLDDVRGGMAETGYPAERIHYHVGPVEQTVPDEAPDEIALLRLDTDWYESTRHELEHLYSRVPRGGVVILDDYGTWQGARQAVDEFLERTGERLLLMPVGEGRIAVKP